MIGNVTGLLRNRARMVVLLGVGLVVLVVGWNMYKAVSTPEVPQQPLKLKKTRREGGLPKTRAELPKKTVQPASPPPQRELSMSRERQDIFYAEIIERLKKQIIEEMDAIIEARMNNMKDELREFIASEALKKAFEAQAKVAPRETKRKRLKITSIPVKYVVPGEKAVVLTEGGEIDLYVGSNYPYPECEITEITIKNLKVRCGNAVHRIPLVLAK